MKTINFYILFLSVLLLVGCSKEEQDIINPDEEESEEIIDTRYYVAPVARGAGDGSSETDAADFLAANFWNEIRKQLLSESVEVQFVDGEYQRAYLEHGLVFERIGHPENKLVLKGGNNVLFPLKEGERTKSYIIDFRGAQNIEIDGFHFTGNGSINYVVRFTRIADKSLPTKNIVLKNSSFIDMKGIVYGASGCSYEETSHITYQNVTFKRIGVASSAHMIYNAYGTSHIYIFDCHFEDCMGDYVRYRAGSDYGIVKNCVFLKSSNDFTGNMFIAWPQFNSRPPVGDEYFTSNHVIVDNEFTNATYNTTTNALAFYHSGFSPPEWDYLLTRDEGRILQSGTTLQKKQLLRDNFGIDTDKIRMHGNSFSSRITRQFAMSIRVNYGAASKGWVGDGDITATIGTQSEPFDWEP
ncbi:hypothetical protein [Sphingobacterium chuzhouense]|uniref:Right handed beta helix domain-containing protein n=1 Tax=Sphingobacterium chuzhouense TaxID=1742264 RepID=A0ABR7XUP9_9SPHI|nr:hypothetical protein [Sphingobacterium chuzhouense]MBD1422780.1 hypothetical protein [Sphingobacterium chuzhouense]